MDRLGQDVDRDVGLDREHALVDRGRRVRAGHRGADQLSRGPVDDDRHVAELGLDRVALRGLREVGDQLERVEAGVERLARASRRPTPPRDPCTSPGAGRGSRARRPRRAPSGPPARPGSGPGACAAPGPAGSPARSRARRRSGAGRRAGTASRAGRVEAVVLEAEVVEREVAADREQDRVALGGRPVVEVDHVRAIRPGARVRPERPDAEADRRRRRARAPP